MRHRAQRHGRTSGAAQAEPDVVNKSGRRDSAARATPLSARPERLRSSQQASRQLARFMARRKRQRTKHKAADNTRSCAPCNGSDMRRHKVCNLRAEIPSNSDGRGPGTRIARREECDGRTGNFRGRLKRALFGHQGCVQNQQRALRRHLAQNAIVVRSRSVVVRGFLRRRLPASGHVCLRGHARWRTEFVARMDVRNRQEGRHQIGGQRPGDQTRSQCHGPGQCSRGGKMCCCGGFRLSLPVR